MKKYFIKILFAFAFAFLSLPILVHAQEYKYYEFAPDTASAVSINPANAVYQSFYPSIDSIRGIDVWIDNSGSSGTANFELFSENNNLLASKTATISHIGPSWGGTRLHVDFPSSVRVSNRNLYKIKISSGLPNLRLYFSPKIQLVQSNSPYPPPQVILSSAFIGSTAQNFYFKIAFYASNGATPPVISNVSTTLISADSLFLGFTTNNPVDYSITFASLASGQTQTKNWSGVYNFCIEGYSACGETFSVLPDTTYNYQIVAKDYFGNESQVSASVTIPAEPVPDNSQSAAAQSNAPVISQARVVYLNSNSVTITWDTDIAADSKLAISLDPLGNQIVSLLYDSTLELIHTIATQNVLNPFTNYYAALISASNAGKQSTQSLNFTTPQASVNNQNSTTTQSNNESPNNSTPANNPNSTSSVNETNPNFPANQINSGPSGNNDIAASIPAPQITIDSSSGGSGLSTLTIEWLEPNFGEPDNGYRVDVFNSQNELVKQISVPQNTHRIKVDLSNDSYRIIVYANRGNVLMKISEALNVVVYGKAIPFFKSTLSYVLAALALVAAGIAVFVNFKLKQV